MFGNFIFLNYNACMIWVIIGVIVLFLILALSIATYSGTQLQETYEKYNHELCYSKLTGGEFALMVANNVTNGKIKVARTAGVLTDAYSSRAKTVVISDETCDTASVASLTIVAHEFGHALQDLNNSKKFKLNIILMKLTRNMGYFMMPLALVGLFLMLAFSELYVVGIILLALSALIFLLALALKFFSIPLERDASHRGLKLLKDLEVLDENELKMAHELLRSALLTYVGDFLRAILWWTFLTRRSKMF